MKTKFLNHTLIKAGSVSAALVVAGVANASPTLKIDDTRWVTIGGLVRASYTSEEDAAPNGTSRSNDFAAENIRLLMTGQLHKYFKLTFNTERDVNGNVQVLDGIAQFEYSDQFNVWAGRLLMPSDRSNMAGSPGLGNWDFPFVQNYPAIIGGRDEGMVVWGQAGNRFKYQVGAFNGRTGGSNQSDSLLYAARLNYNFWDAEPGYYNNSTYFGEKEILAIGVAAMNQSDGAGTIGARGDYTGWNVDALMEKKLGGDMLSVEGAYYNYDLDNVADASLAQSSGYFLRVGYLFGAKLGIGRLMPNLRFQSLDLDGTSETRDRYDAELVYVIDGHNARASILYAKDNRGSAPDRDLVKLGIQLGF